MVPFVPSPAIKAFYDTLVFYARQAPVQGSGWGGYTYSYLALSIPPIPPRPSDQTEAAFFDNLCMPLYNLLVQAASIGTNIISSVGTTPSPQVTQLAQALNVSTEAAAMIIQQEQQAFTSGP